MIPVLLNPVREDGEAAGARLIQLVLTTLLTFFTLVVLLVALFTPGLVQGVLAPGFDPTTSQLTVTLTWIMLCQPLILAAASVATAVLNSRNPFLLTGLSVISYSIPMSFSAKRRIFWFGSRQILRFAENDTIHHSLRNTI